MLTKISDIINGF